MPLKTLGPIGPKAVGERVNKIQTVKLSLFYYKDTTYQREDSLWVCAAFS
jgi:hypothetical protein